MFNVGMYCYWSIVHRKKVQVENLPKPTHEVKLKCVHLGLHTRFPIVLLARQGRLPSKRNKLT